MCVCTSRQSTHCTAIVIVASFSWLLQLTLLPASVGLSDVCMWTRHLQEGVNCPISLCNLGCFFALWSSCAECEIFPANHRDFPQIDNNGASSNTVYYGLVLRVCPRWTQWNTTNSPNIVMLIIIDSKLMGSQLKWAILLFWQPAIVLLYCKLFSLFSTLHIGKWILLLLLLMNQSCRISWLPLVRIVRRVSKMLILPLCNVCLSFCLHVARVSLHQQQSIYSCAYNRQRRVNTSAAQRMNANDIFSANCSRRPNPRDADPSDQ